MNAKNIVVCCYLALSFSCNAETSNHAPLEAQAAALTDAIEQGVGCGRQTADAQCSVSCKKQITVSGHCHINRSGYAPVDHPFTSTGPVWSRHFFYGCGDVEQARQMELLVRSISAKLEPEVIEVPCGRITNQNLTVQNCRGAGIVFFTYPTQCIEVPGSVECEHYDANGRALEAQPGF